VDLSTGAQVNLREMHAHTFRIAGGARSFTILVGSEAFVQQGLSSTVPSEFELLPNYPNPFNPTTSITVGIPYGSDVEVKIFSLLGSEVATLARGWHEAGRYTYVWDGTNASGKPVSSGLYFYSLVAGGNRTAVRKMILLR
jgi:hypothetical protein